MIVKTKRTKNFTTVPNDVINNKSLSYNSLGLWLYLMSKPSGWVIRMDDLKSRSKNEKSLYGRDLIRSIFKELESFGLAELIKIKDLDGVMHGSSWVVYDTPTEGRVFRRSGKPRVGKTTPIVKTDISNSNKLKKEGTPSDFDEDKAAEKIVNAIESTPQSQLETWAMNYRLDLLDIQDHGPAFANWLIFDMVSKASTAQALASLNDMTEKAIRMKFANSFLRNIKK